MNWRNTTVLYISIVLFIGICIYLFPRWGRIDTKYEHFEANTEYTYTPNRDTPDKSMKLHVNYVVDETIKLFEFFKEKRGLIYRRPPPLAEPPVVDDPYVDDSDAVFASASAPAPAPAQETFTSMIEDQRPADNPEYEGKTSMLDLANKYAKFKTGLEEELDKMFAVYFKPGNQWSTTKFGEACSFYTKEYAYVQYYVVSPDTNYEPNQFLDIWTKLLKKSDTNLDELKKEFYAVIGDSFLYTKLVEYFKSNAKMHPSTDDALFIINTGIQHLKYMGDVTSTHINKDAVRLTNVSVIVSELFQLVMEGNKYPQFKYDYKQFVDDYTHSSTRPKNSLYLFMLNNKPKLPTAN